MKKETVKTIINLICTILSAIAGVICTSACVPKIPNFINNLPF